MKEVDWDRVQEVFARAVDAPADVRDAVVEELGRGDEGVIIEVKRMLLADSATSGFLVSPVEAPFAGVRGGQCEQDLAGMRVGSFILKHAIGHGGMGSVWLAEHEDGSVRRRVAVKIIKRGMDTDEILRRFTNERRVLASLEHPNIARLIDAAALPDGRPAIVMELIEGVRIDRYCDTHGLTVRERLDLFCRVCGAVEHAHNQLIVHRDIKPGNIYVSDSGEPKLFDFGIAKLLAVSGEATRTEPQRRILTPRYASPEQVRGDAVTMASDVYSLGVVLYELLTGRAPFEVHAGEERTEPTRASDAVTKPIVVTDRDGETSTVDPARVSRARGVEPERLRRMLAGDLDTILMTAMHPDQGRRYARAADLAEDIRRHLDNLPVRARQDTRAYRAAKFLRRNRGAVLMSCSVVAILVGSVAVLGVMLSKTVRAEREASRQGEIAREQREIALDRMRESDRAAEFLGSVVLSATPDRSVGIDPEVRTTLLGMIDARAEKDLADEPRVRSRVLYTLGRGYRSVGDLDAAEARLTSVIELERVRANGGVSSVLGDAFNERGMTYLERADHAHAIEDFERAIEIIAQTQDEPDDRTAWCWTNLGNALMHAARYDEADAAFTKGLNVVMALHPAGHEQVIHARAQRVGLYVFTDRLDEAATEMRAIINAAETDPVFPRSTLLTFKNNLAVILSRLGDAEGALEVHDEIVSLIEEHLGAVHRRTLQAESNRAVVFERLGRFAEAEAIYRDMYARARAEYGEADDASMLPLGHLSRLLIKGGRHAEAVPMARRVVKHYEALYGDAHPEASFARATLGNALLDGDESDRIEGTGLLERSLQELTASVGPSHGMTGYVRRALEGVEQRSATLPEDR